MRGAAGLMARRPSAFLYGFRAPGYATRSPLGALAGARAHGVVDRGDEDLALAETACSQHLDEFVGDLLDVLLFDDHLDLELGQQLTSPFLRSSVALKPRCTPKPLTSVALRPLTPLTPHSFSATVELVRLDVALDLLHRDCSFFCPDLANSYVGRTKVQQRYLCEAAPTTPCASIALATFRKPAMFAPLT